MSKALCVALRISAGETKGTASRRPCSDRCKCHYWYYSTYPLRCTRGKGFINQSWTQTLASYNGICWMKTGKLLWLIRTFRIVPLPWTSHTPVVSWRCCPALILWGHSSFELQKILTAKQWASRLFMAKSHTRYSRLVCEPHVEN